MVSLETAHSCVLCSRRQRNRFIVACLYMDIESPAPTSNLSFLDSSFSAFYLLSPLNPFDHNLVRKE